MRTQGIGEFTHLIPGIGAFTHLMLGSKVSVHLILGVTVSTWLASRVGVSGQAYARGRNVYVAMGRVVRERTIKPLDVDSKKL